MEFGLTIFPTMTTMPVPELAATAEAAGFGSLLFPEHTHIPVEQTSIYAPTGSATVAPEFREAFDPLIALTAAAAASSTLRLGTGLCLVAQRDPIILAKEVSTLDVLSNGRIELGVGPGWNHEEMRNHGVDPGLRHRLLEEKIEAMRAIWTKNVASYAGELVSFGPLWQWPKPVQKPHPPILVGGSGPHVLARVVAHGDGWLASGSRERDEDLAPRIATLQRLAAEAGRGRIPVYLQRCSTDRRAIDVYRAAGVDRCIFGLSNGARDEVHRELSMLRDLMGSRDSLR